MQPGINLSRVVGLPYQLLAFESLDGGQFTLSTLLIKPNYLVTLPPTQHHSSFTNLQPHPTPPSVKVCLKTRVIFFSSARVNLTRNSASDNVPDYSLRSKRFREAKNEERGCRRFASEKNEARAKNRKEGVGKGGLPSPSPSTLF